jgi:uncharacterized membrane protein YgcG
MRLFGRRKPDRSAPTYSNEAVIERIRLDAGVDRDTARTWFNEMLVFLHLAASSRDFISPPGPVDTAWHAFILHTRDYEAYRRAYDRRIRQGPAASAIWVAPVIAGGAASDAGGAGWSGGDWGSGSSCGGGGGGGCGGGG